MTKVKKAEIEAKLQAVIAAESELITGQVQYRELRNRFNGGDPNRMKIETIHTIKEMVKDISKRYSIEDEDTMNHLKVMLMKAFKVV